MSFERQEAAARRIAKADALTISNPRAELAHRTFDFMRAQRQQGSERGFRGFLIVGPTQSGKSKILRTYQERANTAEALEAGRIPVLMVTLTANQTRKGLAQDILRAFEPFGYLAPWKSGSETVLLDRVRAYMQARGVELLILDEFQHLVHSERQEVSISVSETIKWLLIESIVPVVMSGIEDAWRPVRANAQLAHRCEAPLELNPLDPANDADRGLFASFLSTYLVELEQRKIAKNATRLLRIPQVPDGLFEVAKGVLGETCNILKAALYLAVSSGRDEIRLEDLELAVDRNYVAYDRSRSNPFRAGLKFLSGRQVHEDA
ncbi:TniB family NTP-binding protein [Phenylobacterium sp. LjRoot164]|uniref:TniB family NTP-binding protein n=1 Tax=unclassified Phenylobacterium TaxID=2640670 RepID=UPI003ED09C3E